MILDCHMHTLFSPDAKNSVEEMVKTAIDKGLKICGLSDHCECNRFYDKEYYSFEERGSYGNKKLAEKSLESILECKEKIKGHIKLLAGVELGQGTFDKKSAQIVTQNKNYDYIIGSMHQIPNMEDFCCLDPRTYDIRNALRLYFIEVHKMCCEIDFDVLAHLTYPIRYIEGDYKIKVDISEFDEIIEQIFLENIRRNHALEINTSGLRQKYGKTFPEIKYVKWYRELGGEHITFGSDAHCVKDLAYGIDVAEEMAKTAGFKYAAYFEKRQVQKIRL